MLKNARSINSRNMLEHLLCTITACNKCSSSNTEFGEVVLTVVDPESAVTLDQNFMDMYSKMTIVTWNLNPMNLYS